MPAYQPPTDCIIKNRDMAFGYRASAIIIEEGHMLLLRNTRDPYLYTVGGGVCIGETSREAVEREVIEEIGVHYEVDRLVMICEDMWTSDDGIPGHQLDFVYLMKPRGTMDGVWGSSFNGTIDEYTVWVPLDEVRRRDVCPAHILEVDWTDLEGLPPINICTCPQG